MAVWAIGDIQGCYDSLQKLLAKIEFNPTKDTLWLVGDLVNRGNKSLGGSKYSPSIRGLRTGGLGNPGLLFL